MDSSAQPRRCPKCNALAVDRRSPVCTTCRVALPKEWVLPPQQIRKLMRFDAACNASNRDTTGMQSSPLDFSPCLSPASEASTPAAKAQAPLHCPLCSSLVVDRTSPLCASCQMPLPAEWVTKAKPAPTAKPPAAQASSSLPHRCPKCDALVVDRRSPVCTTCRVALPPEWVMNAKQAAKVNQLDAQARAEFKASMKSVDQLPTGYNQYL